MDDGSRSANGFNFHTEGFTLNENYLLAALLHYRFGLNITVQHSQSRKPKIRIKAKSMPLFRSIVTPYFHQSMLYKLKH